MSPVCSKEQRGSMKTSVSKRTAPGVGAGPPSPVGFAESKSTWQFSSRTRSGPHSWPGSANAGGASATGAARDVLLTDRLTPVRGPDGRLLPSPIIDAYNRLAECAGCSWPGYRLELATTPRDDEAADAVWRHERLDRCSEVICLNPGAAFGSAKHWPAESFARLAQQIADRRGSGVLVLCGPGEEALARRIVTLAGRHGVVSLAGRPLSLGLTKACIRRCDLLITTDSGPRHFAAAFDRPVVTLFGPTHIAWTETYFHKAIHLQKKVECGPCQLRVCPLDHRCMNLLTPHEVFTAAADLLTRFRGTRPDDSRRVG